MSPHFRAYAQNLTRMSIIATIDAQASQLRLERARASLIANPLSGRPYSEAPSSEDDTPASKQR